MIGCKKFDRGGINWNMPWIGGWIFKGLEKIKILNLTRCSLFCHFTKRESFSSSDQAVKWMKSVPTVHSHPPTVVTPPTWEPFQPSTARNSTLTKGCQKPFELEFLINTLIVRPQNGTKNHPRKDLRMELVAEHEILMHDEHQHPPPTKKRTTSQKKKNRKWERPSNKRRWLNPFLGSDAVWANRRGVPLGTRRGIFEQNM